MIVFTPIFPGSSHWSACLDLYLSSFPSDERRESSELISTFNEKGYKFISLTNDEQFIGFIETWDFDKFVFLEHLAILPERQKRGYGSEVLSYLVDSNEKPILLEAESPKDDLSHRRIAFYERAGFIALDVDYTQPPYYPGKQSVPMLLLSNSPVPFTDVGLYIEIISKKVYKIS